jgi:chloramphenicol 3-O-phosphotransferase
MTQVIVLNGGSSSGKTGIARCLQAILPQPWIRLGVDDLVDALPPSPTGAAVGIGFGQQGEVTVGGGGGDGAGRVEGVCGDRRSAAHPGNRAR